MAAESGRSTVRTMTAADLTFAADLHAEALPDGFFVALGNSFLARYYEAFVASPHAVALLASVDDEPHGVLVGTTNDADHYRWVLRHRRLPLARAAVRALLTEPMLGIRFLRTRAGRYARGATRLLRRGARTTSASAAGPTTGALTHVAVTSASRDNGVGTALVEAYIEAARGRGSRRLRVATRADGGAGDFYRRLGWSSAGSSRNLDGIEFELLTLEP